MSDSSGKLSTRASADHASVSDVAAVDPTIVDSRGVDLQRWRTQRLFDLVVTAAGQDPTRVARMLGVDSRSMNEMRAVPSLGCIARIARALGMTTASAAEVVGRAAGPGPADHSDTAQLATAIAFADLEDDAAALDELASELSRRSGGPEDLALSALCSARADAARGEVAQARERARSVDFPLNSSDFALVAHDLRACIEHESVLGEAWRGLSADEPLMPGPRSGTGLVPFRSTPGDFLASEARRFRSGAHQLTDELLRTPSRDFLGAGDILARMRRHVFVAIESGCPHAVAWSASVAGIAALRIREHRGVPERIGAAAMSLFVSVQLLLDEEIARHASAVSMSLLRRRMRLSLHEWCDRARRGEVADALLDESDQREIRTLCARFPRARPGAIVGPLSEIQRFHV